MYGIPKRWLLGGLAVVFLASLLEALLLSRRQRYDWRAMGVSLLDLIGRQLIFVYLPLSLAGPLLHWAWQHRIATLPLNSGWSLALLFVGLEFFYYWYHRASHRMRWFWANHSVHHSPNQLNYSAAYRLGLFGKLIGNTLFFAPLVWLGFTERAVLTTLSLNLLYQFWIHATWIPKLGPLEWILNTPSAHRVHHASNLEYMDANYGGVLIVFDRLFGTYIAERDDLPCRYGLVHPQTSYNPLRVEFDAWMALAKDVWRARRLRDAVALLLKPPGWRPDGPGETTEELRARAA